MHFLGTFHIYFVDHVLTTTFLLNNGLLPLLVAVCRSPHTGMGRVDNEPVSKYSITSWPHDYGAGCQG